MECENSMVIGCYEDYEPFMEEIPDLCCEGCGSVWHSAQNGYYVCGRNFRNHGYRISSRTPVSESGKYCLNCLWNTVTNDDRRKFIERNDESQREYIETEADVKISEHSEYYDEIIRFFASQPWYSEEMEDYIDCNYETEFGEWLLDRL